MAKRYLSFEDFKFEQIANAIREAGGNTAEAKIAASRKLAELQNKKAEVAKSGDKLGVKLVDIDIKIAQLELQKADLMSQKENVTDAKRIEDQNKQAAEKAKK